MDLRKKERISNFKSMFSAEDMTGESKNIIEE